MQLADQYVKYFILISREFYILTGKIWDWIFLFRLMGDMNFVRGRNGRKECLRSEFSDGNADILSAFLRYRAGARCSRVRDLLRCRAGARRSRVIQICTSSLRQDIHLRRKSFLFPHLGHERLPSRQSTQMKPHLSQTTPYGIRFL